MKLGLTLRKGKAEETIVLELFPAVIGRQEGCDVRVDDPRVSRRHASIEIRRGELLLVDLGSGNGTLVNGRRTQEHLLRLGDKVLVGTTVLRVERVVRLTESSEIPRSSDGRATEEPVAESGDALGAMRSGKASSEEDRSYACGSEVHGSDVCAREVDASAERASEEEEVQWSEPFLGPDRAVIEAPRIDSPEDADRDDGETIEPGSAKVARGDGAKSEPSRDFVDSRMRRRRVVAKVAPVLILLAIATLIVRWVKDQSGPGQALVESPQAQRLREAQDTLAELEALVGTTPRVTPELIDRVAKARTAFGDVALAGGDRFADLLFTLKSRRELEYSNRLSSMNAEARELGDKQRYGEAVAFVRRETDLVIRECPSLERLAIRLREGLEAKVGQAYARAEENVGFLESLERDEDAIALCEEGLRRFEGTPYAEEFRKKKSFLLERLAANRQKRLQALDELAKAREKESASVAVAGAVRARAPGLAALLSPVISAGALREKKYHIGDREATPIEVTAQFELVLAGPDGRRTVSFREIPAAMQLEMAHDALSGEDLLAAARFAYRSDLPRFGDDLLWKYVGEKKELRPERQPKADELLAVVRGLKKVPDGGFTYTPGVGWEDAGQQKDREMLAAAGRLAKVLAGSETIEAMRRSFAKIEPMTDEKSLSVIARGEVRKLAVEALTALRGKVVERVTSRVKKTGFANLRLASEELKRRRKEALRVIFDTSIYLPENHPDYPKGDKRNGQEAVDKAVGAVRELWDNAASYAATLDSQSRKAAEMVKAIDGEYFERLRHRPGGEASDTLDEVLLNLDRRIDLRHYAANRVEAELHQYNRKVDAYNDAVQDPELTELDRRHVKVLNDYREMLGLRRLFIDLRICRATRKHSAACDAAGRIWHDGPDGSPGSRAQAEGFPGGVAENVAIGYSNGEDIWNRGWYRASDHHRNALGAGHTCIGYGYVGRVGTQNFAAIAAPFP